MCDRPAEKAVRSPWTDGAWLMEAGDAEDRGWWWRWEVDGSWRPPRGLKLIARPFIVEARPTPQEDQ